MSDLEDVEVRLFGGPVLTLGGEECRLSPFQAALVSVVFAEEGLTRPEASRILWSGEPDSRSRHRLRQLRHNINRKVGAEVLAAAGDRLSAPSFVQSDVRRFHAAVVGSRLREAATTLNEGFLTLAPGTIGESFDDWREALDAAMRRRVKTAANALWEAAQQTDDWTASRDAAEALHLLDPGDTDIVARVIETRAREGRLREAEAAYAEYREALRSPQHESPKVEAVISRVREAQRHSEKDSGHHDVPFVGRRSDLASISKALSKVVDGSSTFVLIAGEAGIGKSRLLTEVRRVARLEGLRCLDAQAVEMEKRIPLNPVLDALASIDIGSHLDALGEPWRTVIGSMLPPNALDKPVGHLPPIEESGLSRRLLDAYSMILGRLAEEEATLFFLDDIHWADETTIAALQFFQRRWPNARFGVVATIRPDLVVEKDPVAQYLRSGSDLPTHRVDLEELVESEARELIGFVAQKPIDEPSVEKLVALAGMHPLYLTELVRDYLAERLELPASRAEAISIPISLRQILLARTDALSSDGRRVADMLAVASKAMRLRTLATLCDVSLEDAADATEELRRQRLGDLDRDKVWISHELFRSAIYRELSESRRAILHLRIAEFLESSGEGELSSELAVHFDRAGDMKRSAEHGWRAGIAALEHGAVAEAAHLFELVTRNEGDERRKAEATARLATALHFNRDMSRANPALELASVRLRATGRVELARRMDIRRVEGLYEAGDTPVIELVERLELIKRESRDAEDWEAVALALDVELRLRNQTGSLTAILNVFAEMRATAARHDLRASAVCHLGLAMGVLFADPEAALSSAHEAVRLTRAASEHRLKALWRLMVVLQFRGQLLQPQNSAIIMEAQELAAMSGDVRIRFSIESNLASALLDSREFDRAEEMLARSTDLLGSADMTLNRFIQANNHAELELANGDFEEAQRWFLKAATYLGTSTPSFAEQLVNGGLGLCALELGDLSEARQREENLGPIGPPWYFDPSTLLEFKVRALERRQKYSEALELLKATADDLEGRLQLAWLKVNRMRLRKMLKWGAELDVDIIARASAALAADLQLTNHEKLFSDYLSSRPST